MLDVTSSHPLLASIHDPLTAFVDHHQDALRCAAHLLGRGPGVQLVNDILERLEQNGRWTSHLERRLDRLEALLGLNNVHIEGSIEEACFALLDPGEAQIEEICLLLDGLRVARATTSMSVCSGSAAPCPSVWDAPDGNAANPSQGTLDEEAA